MPYDFDRLTDRRQSSSIKWDVTEQELPMWVSDMDFETAPAISSAVRKLTTVGENVLMQTSGPGKNWGGWGELCAANHVTVISDEIHCDLTEPGYDYIPFVPVSQVCAQNSI